MTAAVVLAALIALGIPPSDRSDARKPEQLEHLADGIARATSVGSWPVSRRDRAALLITIGWHESNFRIAIHEGLCLPWECDRGRARGVWQMHKNRYTAPVWERLIGVEYSVTQARTAMEMLHRSYWSCARAGVPWLQGTLNAYAGRRCSDDEWQRSRVATFAKVKRRLG